MSGNVKLSPDDSRRLIESAVSNRAPVILESAKFPAITINGALISADEQALLMEVTGTPAVSFDAIVGATVNVQVYDERRLTFPTRINAAPQWGRSRAISLDRPRHVQVVERRRFLRAKLAPSSHVTLEWQADGQTHRHTATLLNISIEGIACRVERAAADAIQKRTQLTAMFELPGAGKPFVLRAIVSNKTPASEGWSILGIQFLRSEREAAALSALRSALEQNRRPSEATSNA